MRMLGIELEVSLVVAGEAGMAHFAPIVPFLPPPWEQAGRAAVPLPADRRVIALIPEDCDLLDAGRCDPLLGQGRLDEHDPVRLGAQHAEMGSNRRAI